MKIPRFATIAQALRGKSTSTILTPSTAARAIPRPPDATDAGTDAYQVELGGQVSDGDIIRAFIGSANDTSSPTLELTKGKPTGAKSIVTLQGSAFANMLEARPHEFMWDEGNDRFVVLDPAHTQEIVGSDSRSLTWYEDFNISMSSGSYETIFDIPGPVELISTGGLMGQNVGMRLTVDGSVPINRPTQPFGRDGDGTPFSIFVPPYAYARSGMKLEIYNSSPGTNDFGWRAATRA